MWGAYTERVHFEGPFSLGMELSILNSHRYSTTVTLMFTQGFVLKERDLRWPLKPGIWLYEHELP